MELLRHYKLIATVTYYVSLSILLWKSELIHPAGSNYMSVTTEGENPTKNIL